MSTYIRQRVWRWLAISATGAAVAALARVVRRRGGGHAPPPTSRPSDEAAAQAALEIAGGAMSDEGGPVRNG
jgi:fructose-1,6-bisphosphatase/inositol monophosphatase family enzyme